MLKLGPFDIDHPFLLAPMAGITNSPYRRLMKRMKSAVVISELVSANGMVRGAERTLDLLRYHEEERKVGLQIFGEDAETLAEAAKVVEKTGADFVDLNLGCPVPKVVSKGAGSAMCRDPKKLFQVLSAMVGAVKIPVTIKIRTGWDQSSKNAHEIVQVAYDAGVAWVAIHGRTRAQGYSGDADWDFIGEIKAKAKLPILGNGDVTTPERAMERYQTYGVDAVMIGRGALRNPFLFKQSRALFKGEKKPEPTIEEYIGLMHEQREILLEDHDGRRAMQLTKKFLSWYATGFTGCHDFRKKVFSFEDPDALWKEANEFFHRATQNRRDMSFLNEPFLMGGHG